MATKDLKVTEEEFEAVGRALARDVVDAHIHWDQHNALQAQLEKWPDVQKEAWSFWYYTLMAHRNTALAALARVFDQEKSALHLRSWLELIGTHLHLFGKAAVLERLPGDPFASWMTEDDVPTVDQLSKDLATCDISDPDVAALLRYRNVSLAHRGAKQALPQNADKIPALLHEQIDRLLERAQVLLNRYHYLFGAAFYGMTPLGHDAVEQVFEAVHRDLEHREHAEAARLASAQAKLVEFEQAIADINTAAGGREEAARLEREALAKRFGYSIDAVGHVTGFVIWRTEDGA